MKQQLFLYAIIGILCLSILGCEKNDNDTNQGEEVQLYLLDSYSTLDNSRQIDESTVNTKNAPLIKYSDFLSYDSSEYTFELSDEVKEEIYNLEHSVQGIAFAIKVDDTLIYTGYFWPGYPSASCDWVVIDPMSLGTGNKIIVNLGYPSLIQGQSIIDKRNDIRILSVFERDNKLIN